MSRENKSSSTSSGISGFTVIGIAWAVWISLAQSDHWFWVIVHGLFNWIYVVGYYLGWWH